jgi:hypothetical protein
LVAKKSTTKARKTFAERNTPALTPIAPAVHTASASAATALAMTSAQSPLPVAPAVAWSDMEIRDHDKPNKQEGNSAHP